MKIALGLIALASVNWWIVLIAWTWFSKPMSDAQLSANGLSSFFVLLAGMIAYGYNDVRKSQ